LTKQSAAEKPAWGTGEIRISQPISLPQPVTRSWVLTVQKAAGSVHPAKALGVIANGKGPAALLAGFGISLLSSTLYSGEKVAQGELAGVLNLLSESLAADMETQDIADIKTEDALEIYVRAINQQPIGLRRQFIKWILSLDLYIRARVKLRDPIPLSKLPWPPEGGSFEVGFVTHEEFREILSRIEQFWDARDSPRRREMIRLIVVTAFRLGLRADEIRQLRMRNLLLQGEPQIVLWPWPGDRLKTKNARRRIPLKGLVTDQELADLTEWWRSRSKEKATGGDRLFAIPEEKLQKVPGWLFDDLNDFLRAHSEGRPNLNWIHMHTFRHACQCWLFTAMMMLEGGISESPFPNLELTNQFLAGGADLARAEFGHDRPTGKRAYMQAAFAGHASFNATTARSYIHLFPWLLASFLEVSQTMAVEESLVNMASGAARHYTERLAKTKHP
jgi:integrase